MASIHENRSLPDNHFKANGRLAKKYAIFTAADSGAGDFLVNHWLPSLKRNVNLDQIDVQVLDYGLSPAQIDALAQKEVKCHRCKYDGFVVSIRFRDLADCWSNCPTNS